MFDNGSLIVTFGAKKSFFFFFNLTEAIEVSLNVGVAALLLFNQVIVIY